VERNDVYQKKIETICIAHEKQHSLWMVFEMVHDCSTSTRIETENSLIVLQIKQKHDALKIEPMATMVHCSNQFKKSNVRCCTKMVDSKF
jgi:hypothetical protein